MEMETIEELKHLKPVEWLTTGQMIDHLNVNYVAESDYEDCKTFVIKKEHGYFMHVNKQKLEDGLGLPFQITVPAIIKAKWRILPKYVSFEEAVQAYKIGKTITCYYPSCIDGKECSHSFSKDVTDYEGDLSFHMIVNGKWTIEN